MESVGRRGVLAVVAVVLCGWDGDGCTPSASAEAERLIDAVVGIGVVVLLAAGLVLALVAWRTSHKWVLLPALACAWGVVLLARACAVPTAPAPPRVSPEVAELGPGPRSPA
jgi:hypothetical protein